MSKTITLIRHAKSSWRHPNLSNFDRPLDNHGQQSVPIMGQRLAEKHFLPDIMISSPARRARDTAQAIAQEIGYPNEKIVLDQAIYKAWLSNLTTIINCLTDDYQSVALVGHNPGLTTLCNHLSRNRMIDNLPTCGIWQMRFDVESWRDIKPESGQVLIFDCPKNIS